MVIELASELRRDCHNTILVEGSPEQVDSNLIWYAQMYGVDVLFVDRITPDLLEYHEFTGMILYNVTDHPGLGYMLPSVYYSYGAYDPEVGADITLVCSNYARHHDRHGVSYPCGSVTDSKYIIPPMLQTRPLRRLTAAKRGLVVGLFSSGSYDKYPCDLAMHLMATLPTDTAMMISTLPKYKHPGMTMALDDRIKTSRYTSLCPVKPGAGIGYLVYSDIVVYGSSANHYEPYGRLVTEAMALGKPVVCEGKGAFLHRLEHETDCLMYDTVDEAAKYVKELIANEWQRKQLGANAQLHASWEDVTAHIGRLRRILRMIGV